MTSERRRKAAEIAMRRRAGTSKAHSEKIRTHMLAGDDLYTTCQGCGKNLRGSLDAIMKHVETCDGT